MNWFKNLFGRGTPKDRRQVGAKAAPQNESDQSVYDAMFSDGVTYGEAVAKATGGANLVDGKQTWEHAGDGKHNIELMKRCCAAEIETYEKTGDTPSPYFFWRVAVLSSKQKNYEQEVEYLQSYLDILRQGGYSRDDMTLEEAVQKGAIGRAGAICERLPKAKQRLENQRAAS